MQPFPSILRPLLAAGVFALPGLSSGRASDPGPGVRAADSLRIAAAANLVYAMDELDAGFRKASPGIGLTVLTGASGSLVAQIGQGAPIDLFLSADMDFPQQLVRSGLAEKDSLTVFALGRLVLWTTDPGLPLATIAEAVRAPAVGRIAIANPRTAPYGRAAREALVGLGVWRQVEARIVLGENITQTAQFVSTGNASLGFVAMSLVLSPNLTRKGRWIEVPPGLYRPIAQGAVITSRGRGNPAAAKYLRFLGSPPAREILGRFGYRLP